MSCLIADGQHRIIGTVKDMDGKEIENAVLGLYSNLDSVLVKSTISDSSGHYTINEVDTGSYFLTCTTIEFGVRIGEMFTINELVQEYVLMDFIISPSFIETKEVVVSGTRSFIEIKADKIIIRPESSITSAGASAWDVILRAPGVTVGANETISLRGKSGVEFYLDERPMFLGGEELINTLKAMPASAVETIEVITNPGARYDAEGGAGIIVIRQKKSKVKGWRGSFSSGFSQGFYSRTNQSFNVSSRFNKFNFYANGSYSRSNTYQDLTIRRNFFNDDGSFASGFRQHTWLRSGGNNYNGRVRMDFYANAKMTFGASVGGFYFDTFNKNDNESILSNEQGQKTSTVYALNPLDRKFNNINYNFNFNYKIDSLGQNVSLNADYLRYASDIEQSLLNRIYSPENTLLNESNLISNLPSTVDIVSVKADYTAPLSEFVVMETGVKISSVATDNKADFSDEINGELVPNYLFSNQFLYKENISAFYVTFSLNRPRYSVQLGLRDEATLIEGDQLGNPIQSDSSFTREFNNFFPTVFAMILLDSIGKHVLTFNAGRRIDRPNYQDMNPFTYPLDQFTLYSGNPFLVPSFTYSTDLSYTFNNQLTSSILYNFQEQLITEVISQEGNTFFSKPGNLSKQHSFGFAVNANISFKKKFVFQCYSEVMNNIVLTDLNGNFLDNRGTYWYVGPMISWSNDKLWGMEIGGNYTTRVASGQFRTIAVATMRVGVSKKVFGGKGTFKLACEDVFHSNRPGGDILGLGASTASWKSRFDSQVISFSFSYRFSKGSALKARTQSAADMEKGRVK